MFKMENTYFIPMKRLSVSLDDNTDSLITKLSLRHNVSKAEIVRRCVCCYSTIEDVMPIPSIDIIKVYIDYLSKGEHVILDVAHWKSIFSEIGAGSKNFWDEVYKIGKSHREEYYDKGLRDIKQILEYVEKTNWYKLNVDSKESYTLILAASESGTFIKTFFEGFFDEYPRKVDIVETKKKIRINVR